VAHMSDVWKTAQIARQGCGNRAVVKVLASGRLWGQRERRVCEPSAFSHDEPDLGRAAALPTPCLSVDQGVRAGSLRGPWDKRDTTGTRNRPGP
jgi:hypothetical protein